MYRALTCKTRKKNYLVQNFINIFKRRRSQQHHHTNISAYRCCEIAWYEQEELFVREELEYAKYLDMDVTITCCIQDRCVSHWSRQTIFSNNVLYYRLFNSNSINENFECIIKFNKKKNFLCVMLKSDNHLQIT